MARRSRACVAFVGGWSGLAVDAEGKRFFSISDAGSWMSGEIAYKGDQPVGIEGVRLGPIRAKSGEVLVRKRFSDAEGLTLASGTPEQGTALISFERKQRIGRFATDKGVLSPPARLHRAACRRQEDEVQQGTRSHRHHARRAE